MALFQCNYPSAVMNKMMGLNVILPDNEELKTDEKGKFPVVYLLHGYTDDYTMWLRMSSVERYAEEHGIAIVMPDGGKSFYADMIHGDPYFTHITEEVMANVTKWFPISTDPNYNFVAGLSMGGYGAMKVGLTCSEKFRGVASFSGALNMAEKAEETIEEATDDWLKRLSIDIPLAVGRPDQVADGPNDVFWLVSELKSKNKKIPELYISCGTDDFIYDNTVDFAKHLEKLDVAFDYYEEENEEHTWGFWDREIDKYLKWIKTVI